MTTFKTGTSSAWENRGQNPGAVRQTGERFVKTITVQPPVTSGFVHVRVIWRDFTGIETESNISIEAEDFEDDVNRMFAENEKVRKAVDEIETSGSVKEKRFNRLMSRINSDIEIITTDPIEVKFHKCGNLFDSHLRINGKVK